jgi:hypothetical protein
VLFTTSCFAVYLVLFLQIGSCSRAVAALNGLLLAFGSTAAAAVLHSVTKNKNESAQTHFFFPFHNESLQLALHWSLALTVVIAPLFFFGFTLTLIN